MKAMFTIFKEESLYWQEYFGLYEFKIHFTYKNLKDCWADILFNWEGMIVNIRLNKGWTGKTEIEVRRCAFHEVCHIIINELNSYCYHKNYNELGHKIIRRLEKSVFERDIKSRFPKLLIV